MWVGIERFVAFASGDGTSGDGDTWQYSNGGYVNEFLFGWKDGEPDNFRDLQNCVHFYKDSKQLADVECDTTVEPDNGTPFYGICEIPVNV